MSKVVTFRPDREKAYRRLEQAYREREDLRREMDEAFRDAVQDVGKFLSQFSTEEERRGATEWLEREADRLLQERSRELVDKVERQMYPPDLDRKYPLCREG